ncbi:MAG: sodium:solute symporter family protein [Planctomycetaceae bacterium]|nr:sodium:solute symporter family protein [Planctomycetaceae bacterium]
MNSIDFVMLALYFVAMFVIGFLAMKNTKTQSDYFLGGRSFGKLLQTFAAFGAGTGAHEPVMVGRAIWTSGLSGVWSAMQWMFVTPIYWITAVWYRRMRHLTLGDWFVERYESRAMGVAFTIYALVFYMAFLSTMLTAIAKFAVPLLGVETIAGLPVSHVIVPALAITVVVYGVLGGLTAAYWTDLVQGLLIIVLSVLLIPFGLWALSAQGDQTPSLSGGFAALHAQLPADFFSLFGGPASGEFPMLYVLCFSLLSLVGIVVQPHFIATGGGSAKTEYEARFGLVVGNYLKRLCTIGWALTSLLALALLANSTEIAMDPDRAWGVAAREILGPLNMGLVGLMFACLLAAMMSSADAYMLVSSALVVRNVYAAYIDPNASEARYVWVGRVTGMILVFGATIVSLVYTSVWDQFKLAMEFPILFAAPFWLGLFWRRVNTWAVWLTIGFSLLLFFILPFVLPEMLALRKHEAFQQSTVIETVTTTRTATPADFSRHEAWVTAKQQIDQLPDSEVKNKKLKDLGKEPSFAEPGQPMQVTTVTGGRAIYWQSVKPDSAAKEPARKVILSEETQGERTIRRERWEGEMIGEGPLNIDFLIYAALGVDLSEASKATLEALRLPTRLALPFLVLIGLSYVTPRNRREALDRYYVKMKTPVAKDATTDAEELQISYSNPKRFEHLRMFPGTEWEMLRPTRLDVVGFVVCAAVAAFIIWLLVLMSSIGSTST